MYKVVTSTPKCIDRKTENTRRRSNNNIPRLPDERPNIASNPIPVRISSRPDAAADDNEGFHTPTRRRSKRYFIGGYTHSLSIPDLTSYVNSCGPTVTNVRVFPLRQTRNKIIVHVHVEANDCADTILQPDLWPRGVVCKRWLLRDALARQHNVNQRERYHRTSDTTGRSSKYDQNYHTNRYTRLDCDTIRADVD